MADITSNFPQTTPITARLTAPFAAVFNFLVGLADKSHRAQQMNALAKISDAQLAARGTTRIDEVRRVLAGSLH